MDITAGPDTHVVDLQLGDVVADLLILLNTSSGNVDGITVTAEPHPAFDPAAANPGEGAWLVRLTDSTGRSRVAELGMRTGWREDSCWHLETQPAIGGDRECRECGTTESATARCPDCNVIVTDRVTYFGVHTASCGYWDERCRGCHTALGPEDVHPDQPDRCRACSESQPTPGQDQP